MAKKGKETNKDYHLNVYSDIEDGKQVHYVRLCLLGTPKFSHGIAFAQTFEDKEDAEKYKDDCWEYLNKVFDIKE